MNMDVACISFSLLDTQSEKITYVSFLNILYSVQNIHMWAAEQLTPYTLCLYYKTA